MQMGFCSALSTFKVFCIKTWYEGPFLDRMRPGSPITEMSERRGQTVYDFGLVKYRKSAVTRYKSPSARFVLRRHCVLRGS